VRLVIVLVALVAALTIPAGLLLARGDEEADFRGSRPAASLTLPEFSLEDDEGQEVRSAELRGKALAVTFLDVRCTEACPIIAAQIGQALRALGNDRRQVEALAISVDPVRDTAAGIDAFLRRYRAKGALRYLDGTVAQLRPVWRGFSVLAAHDTGEPNMHSAPVRVYDGDGRWRSTLHSGVDLTPANLAHDLRLASS
jgi:cytochrome oxidase Cu insertion factor (SCO1/SenC/PrrC family)